MICFLGVSEMYDIVGLGELLIDFTPAGKSEAGGTLFERNAGGAPPNVLAIAAKLGLKTAFIGTVGNDDFGKYLKQVLESIGIGIENLIFAEDAKTTLAFVQLNDKGDRSFSFYRNPGADMLLNSTDLNMDIIRSARIFQFGTISLTHDPARTATINAVSQAKDAGALISFDPNLRPPLWNDLKFAKEMILKGMEYADILKLSNEELEFVTGTADLEVGSNILYHSYKLPVILVTLGPGGCFYKHGKHTGILSTYDVQTVDTTGAGDAFSGAFLYQIIQKSKPLNELVKSEIEQMIDFANAAGSLATIKKGAIPAMPGIVEIEKCIKEMKKLTR